MRDVIVAGLGATGSAAAYHLARRGLDVLGLDRFAPPHAQGSSHGRSRIIREAYFEDPAYVPLVQRAYTLWDELAQASGRKLLATTGGLMIGPPDGVLVSGALRSARAHRLPHELLSPARVTARFPALRPGAGMVAVWEPRAGILDPEACIDAHLAAARAHGATLAGGEPLVRWHADGTGIVVHTARAAHRARQLLLSAGAWLPALAPALPLRVERQVMLWFAPSGRAADFAPERCPVHLWEDAPGRFFYGMPDLGEGVKLAIHHQGEASTAETLRREVAAVEVAALRARVLPFVPGACGALRAAAACMYTNTPDAHFWIDRHPDAPGVLVASACSGHGFKFAPALGEALADLLTGARARPDLAPFRAPVQ